MEKELITHYSAVLSVHQLSDSIDFYCFKLGFELASSYGNPPYYAEIRRGQGQSLMLIDQSTAGPPSSHVSLAFYSEDIDTLYAEFQSRQVPIKEALEDKAYGMREFQIEDPNGYLIIFRQTMR